MSIVDLACEPRHLPTLAAWHHAEWQDLNPGDSLQQRILRMQDYLDCKLIPSTFVYKLADQSVAGSAAIIACDMDTRRELTPWLASVYVKSEHRRKGIGSALVRHVMQQAGCAGISQLYLFTPDQSEFYHKLGWRRLFEEDYREHKVTVMSVDLPTSSLET